jgi:hypothetical protein
MVRMRDVYACRLPLAGDGPLAFDRAVGVILAHTAIGANETRRDSGSLSPSPGTALRWRSLNAEGLDDRLWTLWSDRPHENDPELSWALTVRVGMEAGRAWVAFQLGLRSLGYTLTPVHFDLEPPTLVGALVEELEVVEDHWHLSAEPLRFANRLGASELADLLVDPLRVLPVVVATTDPGTGGALVDVDDVAAHLVGLSHVALLESVAVTFALTDLVGKSLSVFGGAVRLYWPGFDHWAAPSEHPLWLPHRLAEARNQPLADVLLRLLAPIATFRLTTAPLEARIRATTERSRRADTARWRDRANQARLDVAWQDELERSWDEAEQLRADNVELAAQLAVAQENLRAMATYLPRPDPEQDDDAEENGTEDNPESITEAVEAAAARCEHLVFLDEARSSARKASYRQPGRLWRALLAMDEVAGAWGRGDLAGGFHEVFAERGLAFRSRIGSTTLGKWAHEYERSYDGRRIALGPHLALGKGSPEACCRVYFHLDEARHLFVVGHVGNHLSDSTSG